MEPNITDPSGFWTRPRTRRNIFGLIGAAASILALGGCASDSAPQSTPQPGDLPHDRAVSATATAVAKNRVDSSFHPEGPFTSELFEKVRRSVVILSARLEEDRTTATGTAWCIANNGSEITLVTARHAFTDQTNTIVRNPTDIRFNRPLDRVKPALATSWQISYYPQGPDLAVVRLTLPQPVDIPALPYEDNNPLRVGTEILTIGFPHQFYDRNPEQAGLYAIVTTITETGIGEFGPLARAPASSDHGASGSPVFNPNGQVIGLLYGTNRFQDSQGLSHNMLCINPLNLNTLLTRLS